MRGIKPDAVSPTNPENIRGAKELISNNMEALGYLEVDDQPAFAEKMDLSLAQKRCPSFDKFLRETKKMILELENLSG